MSEGLRPCSSDRLTAAIEGIARHILSTTDATRSDRLWPAHYRVFATNPLSIAYGACGVAEFVQSALGEIPKEVYKWLETRLIGIDGYPPGLLLGTAGVAYQFHRLGMGERAREILELSYASRLRFADPTMFFGAAGWGLVSLYFYQATGDPYYLAKVGEACEYLISTARSEGGMLCWAHSMDGEIHLGYGYGASGIALFLLRAGLALGKPDVVECASRALSFDLQNRMETPRGWAWPHQVGGKVRLPYWAHGAAGVGVSAIRISCATGQQYFRTAAESIAESVNVRWTVLPSQLDGIAGIGEFMLDMFLLTGRQDYWQRAATMAETALWYAVERDGGLAFPGRWHSRLTTDYATGSAGIGLFFLRLRAPGPRFLVDLADADVGRQADIDVSRPPCSELAMSNQKDDALGYRPISNASLSA